MVYEEAAARVQLRVSRATWQAFELLAREKVVWSTGGGPHAHASGRGLHGQEARYGDLAEEIRKLEGSDSENAP
jgi:hypothetical protein